MCMFENRGWDEPSSGHDMDCIHSLDYEGSFPQNHVRDVTKSVPHKVFKLIT